jgi:hypothetical protein
MNAYTYLLQISSDSLTNTSVFSAEYVPYIIVAIILVACLTAAFLIELSKKKANKTQKHPELVVPSAVKKTPKASSEKPDFPQNQTNKKPLTSAPAKAKPTAFSSGDTKHVSPKSGNGSETNGTQKNNEEATPVKPTSKKENKVIRIQFEPVTIFNQQPPYHYPYICMPQKDSLYRKPGKARSGRIGRQESRFGQFLHKYFTGSTVVSDDKSLVLGNRMLSPDFCIIHDPNGKNITIVIEIDEPYEGLPEIAKRKPIHYLGCGDERNNNDYTKRGWVVIRFAEVQVVQFAEACCAAIAGVLKALDSLYSIPHGLQIIEQVPQVKQWTEQEALAMSEARFRERYLGITNFGFTEEPTTKIPTLTEEEKAIEELIEETVDDVIPGKPVSKDTLLQGSDEPVKEGPSAIEIVEKTIKQVPKKSIEEITRGKELAKAKQMPKKVDVVVVKAGEKNKSDKQKDVTKNKVQQKPPEGAGNQELIQWAIDNGQRLNFVIRQRQNCTITNYEPNSISSNILTGYHHVEKRQIQYYIPSIIHVTIAPQEI